MSRPVTLITGGGRGIGAATAHRLAAAGHDLVLSYREDDAAAREVATAVKEAGVRCEIVQADVASPASIDRLFDEADALFGRITGLVNNAGATLHVGDLAETPVDVIRQVIEINLTGAVLCARRAVQGMSRRYGGEGGVIVNLSSAAATLGSAHEYVHYAAAKAGIDALTLGLAIEVARDGIRVNGVSPGTVHTDIHAAAGDPERADRIASSIPMGRSGEPDEIAAAIAWLLGDDCSYVTGATLRVSGGR